MSIRNNQNLTEFIKGRVNIISDLEGKVPGGIRDKIFSPREKFIYCGDIADYTGNLNASDPERYQFFKFVKHINDNPSIFAYVLGNRDLNKIKLLQLLVFNEQANKWWRGDLSKPFNILEISNSLLPPNNPEWYVQDLTSFYPYWNTNNKDITFWKGWKSVNLETPLSLYERFLAIFGVDPKDGTMSAQNTIVCMAIELGVLTDDVAAYVAYVNDMKKPIPEEALNRLAALVFTVYARILDPELSGANKVWEYDGLLYEYLMNGNIVSYAFDGTDETNSKKLYLFSHGGVHSNFKKDLMDDIKKMDHYWQAVNEKITEILRNQKGGQIDNIPEDLNFFNESIKAIINNCFAEFKKGYISPTISINLKLTNSITCGWGPFYPDDLAKKESNRKNIEKVDLLNGVILPGYQVIMNDSKNLFRQEKALEIFNIFGHQPVGFGYIFSTSKNGSKIISTDFSNSFSNSNFTDFNKNTFILVLEDNVFSLEGGIYFDLTQKKESLKITEETLEDFYIIKGEPNSVVAFQKLLQDKQEKQDFFITFNQTNQIDFQKHSEIKDKFRLSLQSNLKTPISNADFNYHGTGQFDGFTIDIFSFIKKSFTKNLFLNVSKVQVPPLPLSGGKRKSKIHKKLSTKSKKLSTKTKKLSTKTKKSKY